MHPKPVVRIHPAHAGTVSEHARTLRVAHLRTVVAHRPFDRPSHVQRVHRLQRVERMMLARPDSTHR
jgi:hypothetical protein